MTTAKKDLPSVLPDDDAPCSHSDLRLAVARLEERQLSSREALGLEASAQYLRQETYQTETKELTKWRGAVDVKLGIAANRSALFTAIIAMALTVIGLILAALGVFPLKAAPYMLL